jgi:alkylation response protein AidB-like acyl-CoA dehydrogenase
LRQGTADGTITRMDFDFSADQNALRAAVRDTLAREAPRDYVRRMIDDERGFTDEMWAEIAELGWTGLLVAEEHGGLGLGLVDMDVVLEEMAQLPLPGPFLSSAVFATIAATRLGATELLADLASGAKRGTLAVDEIGTAGDPLANLQTRASEAGDGWVLDGLKPTVLDGHTADWAIVIAQAPDGVAAFLVDAPGATLVPGLDPTRKIARLEMVSRPAQRLGGAGDQSDVLRRILDDCDIALCSELIGACDRAFALAADYAKVRVQFGRPIGTFQAIKHIAADMVKDATLTRVGTHYAAWTSDTDAPDREVATAMAKAWAAEAAVRLTGDCIQIHGGVGFTWDNDSHLFYKRAKANDLMLGRQGWQRRRVADLVLGEPPALQPA